MSKNNDFLFLNRRNSGVSDFTSNKSIKFSKNQQKNQAKFSRTYMMGSNSK